MAVILHLFQIFGGQFPRFMETKAKVVLFESVKNTYKILLISYFYAMQKLQTSVFSALFMLHHITVLK